MSTTPSVFSPVFPTALPQDSIRSGELPADANVSSIGQRALDARVGSEERLSPSLAGKVTKVSDQLRKRAESDSSSEETLVWTLPVQLNIGYQARLSRSDLEAFMTPTSAAATSETGGGGSGRIAVLKTPLHRQEEYATDSPLVKADEPKVAVSNTKVFEFYTLLERASDEARSCYASVFDAGKVEEARSSVQRLEILKQRVMKDQDDLESALLLSWYCKIYESSTLFDGEGEIGPREWGRDHTLTDLDISLDAFRQALKELPEFMPKDDKGHNLC